MDLKPANILPERKSIGQYVFEYLKQAIISGDAPPGDRLVESRIADAMGVSRTPVREAIHKLEREGLLEKRPRGGFTVLGLSRSDIEETFGIRAVLEGYAARLATRHHTAADLKALQELIDEFESHLTSGDLDALPRINTQFHELLYGMSRSPKLAKMISDLGDQIYRFRTLMLKDRNLAHDSHRDHCHMLTCMRQRDGAEVERLAREHILRGQTAVLAQFDQTKVSNHSKVSKHKVSNHSTDS